MNKFDLFEHQGNRLGCLVIVLFLFGVFVLEPIFSMIRRDKRARQRKIR